AVELRLESDQLMNLLSAEDLSKFAASDVGDALKRIAGINVIGGQFAVIRGLEDRYSSTLYNGAPVPSPDPTRQSVQLDLFPSDIVSNIQVTKTFAASAPSNSSGGSIDIVTHAYPEELTFKVTMGSGFNERTLDEFRRYDNLSATGVPVQGDDTIESEYSVLFGGTDAILDREVRFKLLFSNEIDYETRNGMQWRREPQRGSFPRELNGQTVFLQTGGLALGELNRPAMRWDTQDSIYTQQRTYYGGLGFDLDTDGLHKIDGSFFRTEKTNDSVQFRDRGHVPGFDYATMLALERDGTYPNPGTYQREVAQNWVFDWHDDLSFANGKQAFYAPVYESRTIGRERDLSVYQLNGSHDLVDLAEGLKLSWAANYAQTNQNETVFLTRFSFQPNDPAARPPTIPSKPSDFPGGGFYATRNDMIFGQNAIRENQYFSRIDLAYEFSPFDFLKAELTAGYWFEQANRDVRSEFQTAASPNTSAPGVVTSGGGFSVTGATPIEMGRRVFRGATLDRFGEIQRPSTGSGKKEISATNLGGKLTFFEDFDVVGRVRIENLRIETSNDPFTGFCGAERVNPDGSCPQPGGVPGLYPERYLFFDRNDNPNFPLDEGVSPVGTIFNDQILGIKVNLDPVTGFVDCRTR
ncbi:TonB-dependent receptor plug domain-containing protein, partial [Myxococcota bacterium]|nr:TonB-dependent receptor plug domain-containing protein [Myxococcota bacterium]